MKSWQKELILFILASPISATMAVVRVVRRLKLLRLALQPSLVCRTCGAEVSLVGFWRCACGHTYQGHLLRVCPVCGAVPKMVRCFRCGATRPVRW